MSKKIGSGNTPIICEKCKETFRLNEIIVECETLSEKTGVEITYFHCPYCGAEYVVSVTDAQQRERFEKMKKMWHQYGLKFSDGSTKRAQTMALNRIKKFQAEIDANARSLKRVWTNGD